MKKDCCVGGCSTLDKTHRLIGYLPSKQPINYIHIHPPDRSTDPLGLLSCETSQESSSGKCSSPIPSTKAANAFAETCFIKRGEKRVKKRGDTREGGGGRERG